MMLTRILFVCIENKNNNFIHHIQQCSFIKFWFNHWCHMDYLTMSLVPFWVVPLLSMQGQKKLSDLIKTYCVNNLGSEDERRSYMFGMTWGWVINDRIFKVVNKYELWKSYRFGTMRGWVNCPRPSSSQCMTEVIYFPWFSFYNSQ